MDIVEPRPIPPGGTEGLHCTVDNSNQMLQIGFGVLTREREREYIVGPCQVLVQIDAS